MSEIVIYLKREEIDSLISELAIRISAEYQGIEPVLIGVLTGSFIFLSDLVRKLTIPVKIDFIGVSSYGDGTRPSGTIRLTKELDVDVEHKDVLLIEDIVDTGITLAYLIDYIGSFGPKTLKVCTLLDKKERREEAVKIDYAGHEVAGGFLVGYGLDYGGKYRHLSDIFHLKI